MGGVIGSLEMSEDFPNGVGLKDGGDDLGLAATTTTGFDINMKHSL